MIHQNHPGENTTGPLPRRKNVTTDGPAEAIVLRQYMLAQPLDWDDDCEHEMRLQVELWNKLVEIEHRQREAFIALTASDPDVQEAETALRGALDKLEQLKKERARRRSAAAVEFKKTGGKVRDRKIDTTDFDRAITAARDQAKVHAQAAKEARRRAREGLEPKIKAVNAARFAAVKAARKASGLWWGNYNAVCTSYERARANVIKRMKAGDSGAKLRFRRYDGEGRITNQIQGGITVAELYTGAHSQVSLRQPAEDEWRLADIAPRPGSRRDRVGRMILTVTIFTRNGVRKNVRWPIKINRPIPDDAVVKEVVVHRRKTASHARWMATFTCRQPERASPAAAKGGRVVAVDLGWRRLNGGVRVATVMGAAGHDFVVLSEDLIDPYEWLDAQQKHRDALHDAIVARLRTLPWPNAPPPLAAIARWWHAIPLDRLMPHHTARLVVAWRDDDWRQDDFAAAEEWRKHDKRIWERSAHRRRRAVRQRLDFYRKEAKRIVASADIVILKEFRLDRMAQKTDDAIVKAINQARERLRRIAAVSVLRNWIEIEAAKIGVHIHRHRGVSTWLCSSCGTRLQPNDPKLLHQSCPQCNHVFDQDLEGCRNMLAAFSARAALAAE